MIILLPKRFAVLKQAASFDHNSSTTSNRVNKAVLVHVEQTVTMHIVLEGPRSNFEIGGGGGHICDSILGGHKTLFILTL